jgi:chemotaxis protein methyltransferase CheR
LSAPSYNSFEQKYVSPEQRDKLIQLLKENFNLDLSEYSLSSVSRRFTKMFNDFEVNSAEACMEHLLSLSQPMESFLAEFTVNVTEMFRDPNFYKSLRKSVFPILKKKEKIRIWSAACSSGEEPLSLAILLHEAGLLEKTELLGTDISQAMIDRARMGRYKKRTMMGYDKSYTLSGGTQDLSDYFEERGDHWVVKELLSKHITYTAHNLMDGPPEGSFDLVVCRNVLIYFNKILQDDVIEHLSTSINLNKSFLALGSKESIIFYSNRDRFKEIDREYKIYQKIK